MLVVSAMYTLSDWEMLERSSGDQSKHPMSIWNIWFGSISRLVTCLPRTTTFCAISVVA